MLDPGPLYCRKSTSGLPQAPRASRVPHASLTHCMVCVIMQLAVLLSRGELSKSGPLKHPGCLEAIRMLSAGYPFS